ncbi:10788_t:CDS:2, partial [Funneliformis geosporum]
DTAFRGGDLCYLPSYRAKPHPRCAFPDSCLHYRAIAILFLFVIMMLDIKLAELSSSGEEASKVYPVAFLIGTPFLWTLTGSPLFRGDTLYSWFDLTTLGIAHISDPSALQWTNLFAAFSNINSLGAQLYYALTKLAEVRSKTHSNVLFSDIVPDRYDGFHSKPQKSGSHGFGIYVIAVAAAESAIGLAIIVAFYRLRGSIAISNPKRGIICSSCYRGHLQNTWDDGLVLAWLLLLFLGPYGAMVGATVASMGTSYVMEENSVNVTKYQAEVVSEKLSIAIGT